MKDLKLAPLVLVLTLAAAGGSFARADDGVPTPSRTPASATQPVPAASDAASYAERDQAAQSLEQFAGGKQVIIATDYDVHILVGVLLITIIVLAVLL